MDTVEIVSQKVAVMELQAAAFGVSMEMVHESYLQTLRQNPGLSVAEALDVTSKNVQLLSPSKN